MTAQNPFYRPVSRERQSGRIRRPVSLHPLLLDILQEEPQTAPIIQTADHAKKEKTVANG